MLSIFFPLLLLPAAVRAVQAPVAGCECIPNGIDKETDGNIMANIGTPEQPNMQHFNSTYGSFCAVHHETGVAECVSPAADSWCRKSWCYVDPCTCGSTDVAQSFRFTSPLYYSYNNCAGTATFGDAQANDATCTKKFIPSNDASCQTKLSNEKERKAWKAQGIEFEVVMVTKGAPDDLTETPYPANYGEGCGMHDKGTPGCTGADAPEWCHEPWTYVNPCECSAGDMKRTQFLYPLHLFYSYSICGAKDAFISAVQDSKNKDAARCPEGIPSAKEQKLDNPRHLPRTKPVNAKCACIKKPVSAIPKLDCNVGFAQGGKCVNATGSAAVGLMPSNYGEMCGVHLEPTSSDCFNHMVSPPVPWPARCRDGGPEGEKNTGCRKAWCDQPWCYVDPCACAAADSPDMAESRTFPGSVLYYSYRNCAGKKLAPVPINSLKRPSCTTTTTAEDASAAAPKGGFVGAMILGACFLLSIKH